MLKLGQRSGALTGRSWQVWVMLFVCFFPCEANNYGNVMDIDTTGASQATTKQDKLKEGGRCYINILQIPQCIAGKLTSYRMAETDSARMEKYKDKILEVGIDKNIDPAIIAAIISRESHVGGALHDGWGDRGNGFGLMQVDKRSHTPVGSWDSEEHISQGTQILIDMITSIQKIFPEWTLEQQLKGGISAYNAGVRNVQTYDKMDVGTTGGDYANDVVARAQWFKAHGYETYYGSGYWQLDF
ncbi:lysozyme g [Latimeria chalumnae]|uniref:lysozyme g n=1 Tax=Latimeria chalumnae TaxID=7897 RepID=UPI00313D475E